MLEEQSDSSNQMNKELAVGEIQITDANASWNGKEDVLTDISLSVQPKELIVCAGKVGAGKSSLLALVMDELKITSGKAPGLRIRAKIFRFPDRSPTRDQKMIGCPTEFRPDPKLPENPKIARKPESGRIRVIFRARKPEFPESSRVFFGEFFILFSPFLVASLFHLKTKRYF